MSLPFMSIGAKVDITRKNPPNQGTQQYNYPCDRRTQTPKDRDSHFFSVFTRTGGLPTSKCLSDKQNTQHLVKFS